jgi:Asp-tRNA(Asn)/Glu-tRNA(Gln) amidotransferase A subunit family amidase
MIGYFATLEGYNLKEKKVFISQPMKGKTEEQIRKEREELVKQIEKNGGEVIDSIIPDFDETVYKTAPLVYLSRAIDMLAKADVCIFMHGWEDARGCRIEQNCCEEYNIDFVIL